MTRVEEPSAGVTTPSTAPRPSFKDETGNLEKVSTSSPARKQRRIVVVKAVLGAMLLLGLCGEWQKGLVAQTPPPPTVIKVEPAVTQPDGILTLTFSQEITAASAKVGNTDAQIVSPTPTGKTLQVKVAQNTPLGRQGIDVTLIDGATAPLRTSVIVAPLISGLKANKDAELQSSRVAVAGGEIIIQFDGSIPSEIKQKLVVTLGDKKPTFSIPQNDYLVVEVPEDLNPATTYTVQVTADGAPLEKQPKLRVKHVSSIYFQASLRLGLLLLFIYLLYKLFYRIPAGQTRYSFLTMLLLEQENKTYSLSRAQFISWLTVIIWSYLFLYYARGYVEQIWAFPNLGNTVYAFLISLGTLVVAQGASIGQGVKGAGDVHPSPADLVVHGGVLALDRVQQVLWTLIALGMFLRITVSSYTTATALPDIPQELLVLMGLSSAGYLGGKLVRGAGPVVEQITVREGSVIINIKGRHLSKDCFIWLDGVKQPKDNIKIITDDPDSPLGFAKELEITLDITMDDWNKKDHAITVINDDAQRSEWRTGPEITKVSPGTANAQGKVTLTITGAHLANGATLEVTGAPDATPTQDKDNPNLFTIDVDKGWLTEPHVLTVTSNNQKSLFTYKPSAQPGAEQSAASGETTDSAQSTAGEQATEETQTEGDGEQATVDGETTDGAQTTTGETVPGEQEGNGEQGVPG